MDERTLEALRGSILKWERIVDGTGEDLGWKNCPLCLLFNGDTPETDIECLGCPVAVRTGLPSCDGTPYVEWSESDRLFERRADTDELRELARAELEFLRELLP